MTGRVVDFPGRGRGKARAPARASTPKRRAAGRKGRRDTVLSALLATDGGPELLSRIAVARSRTMTAVDAVIPPGTVMDAIHRVLRADTDLPPEMGLTYTIGLLAAAMSQAGSTVTVPGVDTPIEMALWIILLAPSGAGKTLVRDLILRGLGLDLHELPDPGSARAYLDGMAACEGRAIWLRDEFGQMVRQIADRSGPMATLRDMLLRTYDHAAIEVTTHRDGLTRCEHPTLTVIGSSVASTWSSCIDVAMLSDGLLARFLFVVADRRPMSVPLYPTRAMINAVRDAVSPRLRHRLAGRTEYHITPDARRLYVHEWRALAATVGDGIDPAYYRRVTWSAFRLAAIYHIVLDLPGEEIGPDAMRWAWRAVMLFASYVQATLALSDPTFAARIGQVLDWVAAAAADGQKWTPQTLGRAVLRRFRRDIRSASEARQLIELATKTTKFE